MSHKFEPGECLFHVQYGFAVVTILLSFCCKIALACFPLIVFCFTGNRPFQSWKSRKPAQIAGKRDSAGIIHYLGPDEDMEAVSESYQLLPGELEEGEVLQDTELICVGQEDLDRLAAEGSSSTPFYPYPISKKLKIKLPQV